VKNATKWILGGCLGVVVLVVGIALSGVFWLRENKDRLREQAVRVGEEGAEAGRSLGESECL
jgi:hypothetical protein